MGNINEPTDELKDARYTDFHIDMNLDTGNELDMQAIQRLTQALQNFVLAEGLKGKCKVVIFAENRFMEVLTPLPPKRERLIN